MSGVRKPAFAIFACPKRLGGGVVHDMTVRRIDFERLAGANRDIAEVAEQRALVAVVDVAIGC